MSDIYRDEDQERPVPRTWRPIIRSIVDSLKRGDYQLKNASPDVERLSEESAKGVLEVVTYYGETLDTLPEHTWNTSVCRWMGDRWELVVDLYTLESGASDLVLSLQVFETEATYRFKVDWVNVP